MASKCSPPSSLIVGNRSSCTIQIPSFQTSLRESHVLLSSDFMGTTILLYFRQQLHTTVFMVNGSIRSEIGSRKTLQDSMKMGRWITSKLLFSPSTQLHAKPGHPNFAPNSRHAHASVQRKVFAHPSFGENTRLARGAVMVQGRIVPSIFKSS